MRFVNVIIIRLKNTFILLTRLKWFKWGKSDWRLVFNVVPRYVLVDDFVICLSNDRSVGRWVDWSVCLSDFIKRILHPLEWCFDLATVWHNNAHLFIGLLTYALLICTIQALHCIDFHLKCMCYHCRYLFVAKQQFYANENAVSKAESKNHFRLL